MNDTDQTVAQPAIKIVTAWAAVGITSWADAASMLAAIYTGLLIFEWWWKKFWRPLFEARGWLKPKKGRSKDTQL